MLNWRAMSNVSCKSFSWHRHLCALRLSSLHFICHCIMHFCWRLLLAGSIEGVVTISDKDRCSPAKVRDTTPGLELYKYDTARACGCIRRGCKIVVVIHEAHFFMGSAAQHWPTDAASRRNKEPNSQQRGVGTRRCRWRKRSEWGWMGDCQY